MFYWCVFSLVVAVVSSVFGSSGVPAPAAAIARVLFLVSATVCLATLLTMPLRYAVRPARTSPDPQRSGSDL
jgi:uncharacterized membrane protein YtjA (UPF0391 family)